jgi:NAD(P)-dependent dehydrogenase (short-subunit alcohol dehydrogenase family)
MSPEVHDTPVAERPLAGTAALVTGAGQGGGRGIAEALAAAGAQVAVVDLHLDRARQVVDGLPAGTGLALGCDVGDPAQLAAAVDATVDAFGGLRVLVNAAHHMVRSGSLLDTTEDDVEALWRTGPLATLRLMRLCHPHLKGDGVVINFGSGAMWNPRGYGVYAATKEAICALTRTAVVEWGPDGIRAHVIVPFVRSPSMEADLGPQGRFDTIGDTLPLGRVLQPEDLGGVAVFLAGPAGACLTGQMMMCDGGSTNRR